MWGLLRIILLIVNAAIFAWLAYYFATAALLPLDRQGWFVMGGMILWALNFFYALWRIVRLIGLWFDAKGSPLSTSEVTRRGKQRRRATAEAPRCGRGHWRGWHLLPECYDLITLKNASGINRLGQLVPASESDSVIAGQAPLGAPE